MSTRYISLTIGNKIIRQYGGMSKEECMYYVEEFLRGDTYQILLNSWNIEIDPDSDPSNCEFLNIPNISFHKPFKLKIMKRNGSKSKHGVIIHGTIKRFSKSEYSITGVPTWHIVKVTKIEEVHYSSNKVPSLLTSGPKGFLDDIIIKYNIKERSSL